MLRQIADLIRRQHYAQAFAAIRLLAGVVAGVGLIGAFVMGGRPHDLRWLLPFLAVFMLINLLAVWQSSRRRIDPWLLPLSLLDTVFIAALIIFTGGIASPLDLLFLFPIGQVAIGVSPKASLIVAGAAMAAYTGLLLSPFGLIVLAPAPGVSLSNLKVFNVVVTDAAILAFAIAAAQTGQALRSQEHRLLDRSSRLRREVGTLARLARKTARETELAPILGAVLETAGLELGISRSAVLLSDGGGDGLRVIAARGFGGDGAAATAPAAIVEGALVGTVLRQRMTLTGQRRIRRQRSGITVHDDRYPGAAAAPLLVGDACLGCLYVDSDRHHYHWTDDSLLLLEAFADFTAVSVDNTRLYNSLIAEKSKLVATMGAVNDAMLIYEPGGEILLANNAFRTLFDISPQASELSLEGLWAYMRAQQGLGLAGTAQRMTDWFDPSPAELEFGAPARELQRRGKVVFDDNGQALATVLTFHDVTEERQAERVRSEILATVSHELRTPLTSIKGFIQIFERRRRRGEGLASGHELQLVLTQVEHLMALVGDLLDVSHLPGRTMRLTRAPVDLVAISTDQIDRLMAATGRSVELERPNGAVVGRWDEKKVAQVLENLLTNAAKYSEADSAITVRIGCTAERAEVRVRDAGVGVAPEHRADVFEAFFRVDNTTTRRTNGLGIGLYLSKRIVEAHGGEIFVESAPGVGSEFGFSLPFELTDAGTNRSALAPELAPVSE